MLLERNLFSIYRLVIKTPKLVFLAAFAFMVFVAFTQIVYIYKINKTLDFSPILLQYMIEKNMQRQSEENSTLENDLTENITKNSTAKNDYTLIDDSTLLHFRFGKASKESIQLNYPYVFNKDDYPAIVLMKNDHLVFLNDMPQEYLQKHGIAYDLITIPYLEVKEPHFSYFFMLDMQKNEIMLESLRDSFFMLETRFNFHRIMNNITEAETAIDELYLNFAYKSGDSIFPLSINFFQFLTIKLLPPIFFKIIYGAGIIILSIAGSMFMGLLVRYLVIAMFTLFLAVYDRFMTQNQGWLHQYLALLYQRYQQNRLGTLKIMFFYIIANIGMPVLLAFGAYCILVKLVAPALPLLIDEYAFFVMKMFFFIEIFHYVFCRSRTTIKFFPIFSFIPTIAILTICGLKNSPFMMMMLNLNMTFQIINFLFFAFIQKVIVEQNEKGLVGVYCPSISKPRMMFYAGFDISWEKSLPPIWTYFTSWFDYSYFTDNEKCLLEKDYQLLYGRMLGLNERQQIPQEDYELREEPLVDQPSNEMNLIHQ